MTSRIAFTNVSEYNVQAGIPSSADPYRTVSLGSRKTSVRFAWLVKMWTRDSVIVFLSSRKSNT